MEFPAPAHWHLYDCTVVSCLCPLTLDSYYSALTVGHCLGNVTADLIRQWNSLEAGYQVNFTAPSMTRVFPPHNDVSLEAPVLSHVQA